VTVGHLIHIGMAGAGSDVLSRWFDDHPQLARSPRGLAGFDSVYAIARQGAAPDPGVKWRVTSAETLSMPCGGSNARRPGAAERRPARLAVAQAWVCEALTSLFPSAHILIVTRGFRTRPVPAHSPDVHGPDADGADARDYDRLIQLYCRAFPGRVMIFPGELLRDDPATFTSVLADRLGISPRAGTTGGSGGSLSRTLGDEVAAPVWGNAEAVRDDPLFRPYLADYFRPAGSDGA
jgi:hypothetical protein